MLFKMDDAFEPNAYMKYGWFVSQSLILGVLTKQIKKILKRTCVPSRTEKFAGWKEENGFSIKHAAFSMENKPSTTQINNSGCVPVCAA